MHYQIADQALASLPDEHMIAAAVETLYDERDMMRQISDWPRRAEYIPRLHNAR